MSIHGRVQPLPFLVTTEMPCPYLPGQLERKVVTELTGVRAADTYELLSRAGFRRSHSIAYRPACTGCSACVPVRVVVSAFAWTRSHRRTAARNGDLSVTLQPNRGTPEQYQLFTRYLESRHGDGEMVGMRFHEYRAMVEDSPIETHLVEFRDPGGTLVACCLADWAADGISAVYSFFDPDQSRRSLGNYVVIRLIETAAQHGLDYVYLGYWVSGSRKMAYKTRFRPIEGFGPGGWRLLEEPYSLR
ncbi:MAG: putative arginyl-tRNA--protein transferase [Alphaproteobacteria bacterium]|nr:MAG: putative arginyl-tRNA--protein transferase [Alphaproteobacteria bacterium]